MKPKYIVISLFSIFLISCGNEKSLSGNQDLPSSESAGPVNPSSPGSGPVDQDISDSAQQERKIKDPGEIMKIVPYDPCDEGKCPPEM